MATPLAVEPFLEPEADPGPHVGLVERLLAHRWFKYGLLAAVVAALGADLQRQRLAPADVSALAISFGPYALAALAGGAAAAAALWRRPWASAAPADERDVSPRLPVFIGFEQRHVVVIGAGPVGASKIPALLAAGARVTVIAPQVSPLVDRELVHVIEREFRPSDLDGAWFAVAAAPPEVNRAVRQAADARRIFANIADDPVNASAYLGSTMVRGGVTVAFSTDGQAPALAGLLREGFEELLPPDLQSWVACATTLRRRQRDEGVPMPERRPQLLEALNGLYTRRQRPAGES